MKNKKIFKVSSNYISQKFTEGLVMFDAQYSSLYTFNETAEIILKKIKLKWTEEKITAYLVKKYEEPESKIKKDVKILIKEMIKSKIIMPNSSQR